MRGYDSKMVQHARTAGLQKDMGAGNPQAESGMQGPKTGWSHLVRRLAHSIGMREIKAWIRNKVRRA